MTEPTSNPTPDDWRDRLIDRALEERLGGDVPPDLRERILTAAQSEPSSVGDPTMASTTTNTSMGVRGWVLAASLIVNCGLLAMLLASRGENPQLAQADPQQPATEVAGDDALADDGDETEESRRVEMVDQSGSVATEGGSQQAGEQAGKNVDFESKLDLVVSQTQPGEEAEPMTAAPTQQLPTPFYQQDDVQHFPPGPEIDLAQEMPAVPAEPPVAYPSAEVWDELTARREKYKSVELGVGANSDAGVVGAIAPTDGKANLNNHFKKPTEYARIAGPYENGQTSGLAYGYGVRGGVVTSNSPNAGRWGFQSADGRRWRRGEDDFGLQGMIDLDGEWQGSPDGEGIGPGAAGDRYERIVENPFLPAIGGDAISTFSIDVDTASYANVRQMLLNGQVPPPDAVRLEELVNYFEYDYEPPANEVSESTLENGAPFAAHVETAACPWNAEHRLVRIAIKGREIPEEKRPLSNLVFLVDVSGSMNNPEKLPLVKHGLMKLAEKLGENDRVAIVVYASSEGLALPSTPGTEQETILAALGSLQSGGSTAGGAGIRLAYQIAEDNFIEGGTNRVILCTDGDFNVGTTSTAELERLVEQKAKDTKVFLSCIGFGRGNLNDAMMEKITGIGNGNYYYADSERESERIFVKGMTGMLVTIAKDVKIQVEFNPAEVAGYRLLGYENRMLRTQDFNDDKKDAGEIGAGHTVTCLYEIVPAGEPVETPDVDELKYQRPASLTDAAKTEELLTLKMRYKQPDEDESTKLEWPIADSGKSFGEATGDLQFAASVASFGMLLRDSQYKGDANYDAVIEIAESSLGQDPTGERTEFVDVVRAAKRLMPEPTVDEPEANNEEATDAESRSASAPGESDSTESDKEAPAGE